MLGIIILAISATAITLWVRGTFRFIRAEEAKLREMGAI